MGSQDLVQILPIVGGTKAARGVAFLAAASLAVGGGAFIFASEPLNIVHPVWQALPVRGVSRLTASGDGGRLRRRREVNRCQTT